MHRERFAEEWAGHIEETPGAVGKLFVAMGLQLAARRILAVENFAQEEAIWLAMAVKTIKTYGPVINKLLKQRPWKEAKEGQVSAEVRKRAITEFANMMNTCPVNLRRTPFRYLKVWLKTGGRAENVWVHYLIELAFSNPTIVLAEDFGTVPYKSNVEDVYGLD